MSAPPNTAFFGGIRTSSTARVVNAVVATVEALLVEEHDPQVNALGMKGVDEIGITGSAGAIAKAVWHATASARGVFRFGSAIYWRLSLEP